VRSPYVTDEDLAKAVKKFDSVRIKEERDKRNNRFGMASLILMPLGFSLMIASIFFRDGTPWLLLIALICLISSVVSLMKGLGLFNKP